MKYKFLAIGASLGGLRALRAVLSALPETFKVPVAIVQHRLAEPGNSLQFVLQKACALPVSEADDKQIIEPGAIYLAPRGYHLMIDSGCFALSTEDPVSFARPSIDVLFETVAESFGRQAIGAVLTGTGSDGAAGLAAIGDHGGVTIIESPATAIAREMPEAAKRKTPEAIELPLNEIGPYILELSLGDQR